MKRKISHLLLIAALILSSCNQTADKQLETNKQLIKKFTQAINTADWDAFDLLLTDNFTRISQASPVEVNTREAFVMLQKSFYASTPNQKITLEMLVAEGDFVAAYATYTGTQTGPLGELPAKGKSMNSKFVTFFRIENDRIAQIWVEWDNLTMLTQLGHFPPKDEGENKSSEE
jgi:steroid delta-isomerase-like uncharacterized protein